MAVWLLATEILRGAVGTIGLITAVPITAVPITTSLAAIAAHRTGLAQAQPESAPVEQKVPGPSDQDSVAEGLLRPSRARSPW
jgi:hypothetical protein